jgi:hypothetical protein
MLYQCWFGILNKSVLLLAILFVPFVMGLVCIDRVGGLIFPYVLYFVVGSCLLWQFCWGP